MSALAAPPEAAGEGGPPAMAAAEVPEEARPATAAAAAAEAAKDESSDSEAEDGGFDYAALEEAQRIAAGAAPGAEGAAGAAEGGAGDKGAEKKRKQRGGNKESQKRRKRQKREDDILRAKQAGLPVPSLRDALKAAAAAPKASGAPSLLRRPVSYADATESQPTAAPSSSSSSAAPPSAAAGSGQASAAGAPALSPAALARLARESARRARASEAINARTVFITNLSFKMSEQEIREWLGASGRIKELKLARDKSTTHLLGYAHAQFEDAAMAIATIERCDRQELHGRVVRVVPVGTRCQFELPEEIKEDIRALLREAYEGKNLSTVKDAWQKRHPGQKLEAKKWGFKNFSAAVGTIEGIVLEHHLEKKLTNLAFFRDSPAHVAFLQERRRREEEAAKAQADAQPEGARKRPVPGGEETESKRRRGEDGSVVGAGVARRVLAKVARGPCSCVIC